MYNKLIAINQEMYELRKCTVYTEPVAKRLDYLNTIYCDARELKNAAPFLNEEGIDSDMVANAILNYRNAWKSYREVPGTSIPTFHKKNNEYSYNTSNHYSGKALKNAQGLWEGSIRFLDSDHLQLPIIGRIRFRGSKKQVAEILARKCITRIGTAAITLDACGNCYVSLKLASDEPFYKSMPSTGKAVGVDVNLTNMMWDSDDQSFENPKCRRKAARKLAKAQRKLSRMREHNIDHYDANGHPVYKRPLSECKNYREQRVKVAALQKHTANQTLNLLYCTAKYEVKTHDFIFAEDLKVKNLMKNHRLAYAISDVSWSKLFGILAWEAEKYGKLFMKVPPHYTTQACSECGYVSSGNQKIQLGVEEWTCPHCGTHHIRDYNAAKNILAKGISMLKEAGIPVPVI